MYFPHRGVYATAVVCHGHNVKHVYIVLGQKKTSVAVTVVCTTNPQTVSRPKWSFGLWLIFSIS